MVLLDLQGNHIDEVFIKKLDAELEQNKHINDFILPFIKQKETMKLKKKETKKIKNILKNKDGRKTVNFNSFKNKFKNAVMTADPLKMKKVIISDERKKEESESSDDSNNEASDDSQHDFWNPSNNKGQEVKNTESDHG